MKPIELPVLVLDEDQEKLFDLGIDPGVSSLKSEKRLFLNIDYICKYYDDQYNWSVIGSGELQAVVPMSYEKLKSLLL